MRKILRIQTRASMEIGAPSQGASRNAALPFQPMDSVGRFRRNIPDSIPVVVLGHALFRDCSRRVANAADAIGIRGIVAHAVWEPAKAFYLALGFDPLPIEPMTLMVTLAGIRALLH